MLCYNFDRLLVYKQFRGAMWHVADCHSTYTILILDDLSVVFFIRFLFLGLFQDLQKCIVCEHVTFPNLLKELFRHLGANLKSFPVFSFYHFKAFNSLH